MRLTSAMARNTYAMLRESAPMYRWRLPPPRAVKFVITDRRAEYGSCTADGPIAINVSRRQVKSVALLVETMAHEMIHVRQRVTSAKHAHHDEKAWHGKDFKHMTKQVCRALGMKKL